MANAPDRFPSPDGRHIVLCVPTGEEAWGKRLFRLRLDGALLESARGIGRWLFGEEVVWSADSRYLAAQRWDIPDRGPQTSILVVDVDEGLWRIVGPNYHSVMKPLSFHGAELAFETFDVRSGATTQGCVACASSLTRWGELQDVLASRDTAT